MRNYIRIIGTLLFVLISMIYVATGWSLSVEERQKNSNNIIINLKDHSVINGTRILMSDVAYVESYDLDLLLKIDSVTLGRPPQPGNKRIIGRGEILRTLHNVGVDAAGVSFDGAEEVKIEVKYITITGDEIADHSRKYLTNKLDEDNETSVVELQKIPKDQRVPLGSGDVKLRFSRVSVGKSGRQAYLSVNIVVDNSVYSSLGLTFAIKRFRRVVVAADGMRSGNIIRNDNVHFASIDVSRIIDDTFTSIDDVVGMEVKRSMRPGDVITGKTIKKRSAMLRGDRVVILIKSYGLEVRSKGVCQEDGGFGDIIKVMNLDTKKMLFGSVLNASIVMVEG